MATSTATKSRSTATASAAPTSTVEPAATEPGFCADGFLDAPAPGAKPNAFQMAFADLDASFQAAMARQIDLAAPQPGTSMSIEGTVRVPLEPPFWVTGALEIEAERTASGVSASLSGGLGVGVGEGGLFADLMANASIKGEGATAARAAQMLALAIENHVRAVPDAVFIAGGRSLLLDALVLAARASGHPVADLVADCMWGSGHSAALVAAMKDGESSEISAGVAVDGSAAVPETEDNLEIGASGSVGVVARQTIEKSEGAPATTTETTAMTMSVGMSLGPVGGEVELDVPLDNSGGGTFGFAAKATGDAAMLGEMSKYVAFGTTALATAQKYIAGTAPSPETESARAALDGAHGAMSAAITAAESMVLLELAKVGVPVSGGLEVAVELDLAKHTGTVKISLVLESEVETPDGSSGGGVAQKIQIGEDQEFSFGK